MAARHPEARVPECVRTVPLPGKCVRGGPNFLFARMGPFCLKSKTLFPMTKSTFSRPEKRAPKMRIKRSGTIRLVAICRFPADAIKRHPAGGGKERPHPKQFFLRFPFSFPHMCPTSVTYISILRYVITEHTSGILVSACGGLAFFSYVSF